jgi:hypothetical protein
MKWKEDSEISCRDLKGDRLGLFYAAAAVFNRGRVGVKGHH